MLDNLDDLKKFSERSNAERTARSNGESKQWCAVVKVLKTHYHEPDLAAARVLYAAVAAHRLTGQPVWPMVVAPPATMKTELIRALDGLPEVHSIDGVTSKTFISGQIRDNDAVEAEPKYSSLLHRIGPSGVILCSDFSTILAIKSDDRKAILADLRRIYDGELKKEFGTSDIVPVWEGRITFVAGVTPSIDKHHLAIQSLGDRFVMVRWGRVGEEAALQAMMQDIKQARTDLKKGLFTSCSARCQKQSPKFLTRCCAGWRPLQSSPCVVAPMFHEPLMATKRSSVTRKAESAPRLAQQLCQLAKGSARLSHRSLVDSEDFAVAKRAGFDCIPDRRRTMLEGAIAGGRIATDSSTKYYDRQDLEVLGLVEGDHLSERARRLLMRIDQFTETPPSASEGTSICPEVGGTSPIFNTSLYLSSVGELDVYVATSMRTREDFHTMAAFCDEVFSSRRLRRFDLRYFDPTVSAATNHEDKGLIECLMVKCAKVLIYNAGDKESYGKDAEAAMALSLGEVDPILWTGFRHS